MPKKRILVTGGAGFIGSNFCNTHCEKYGIVALDNLLLGDPEHLLPNIKFVEGDATNRETLDSLGSFDYIVHFAGTSSAPMFHNDIVSAYRNSILSFLEVLEFANRTGVKKVLYASTSSLYGNTPPPLTEDQPPVPTNHYAVTKIAMENISACYHRTHPNLEIIGFRFMSVFGPHEEHKGIYANLISQFIWAMRRGDQPLVYGDGMQTRDFTNVLDVVQGITLAMETEKKLGNQIFNIGRGESMTVLELVDVINKTLGTNIKPKHVDNPVTENYIRLQQADITKIQSTLGYTPSVSLEDGIRQIINQLNNQKQRSSRNRTSEANAIPKRA
ncbi:NAD-dependent epimerase/dehydratase family protein [Candidatus Peregrinibacteria bacterium]|nr:NAD-dependent epimerase/dehydratase family protein [Candidatus Peregrinibacteria bacterium]